MAKNAYSMLCFEQPLKSLVILRFYSHKKSVSRNVQQLTELYLIQEGEFLAYNRQLHAVLLQRLLKKFLPLRYIIPNEGSLDACKDYAALPSSHDPLY